MTAVENMMGRSNESSLDEKKLLLNIRNAALHRLVSLSSWNDPTAEAIIDRYSFMYRHTPPAIGELRDCRFAGHAAVSWLAYHSSPTTEVIVGDGRTGSVVKGPSDLLFRSPFMCGLAANESEHRVHFKETLRRNSGSDW